MSETDDTDILLLIPPEFFLVQSSGSDNSLLESSRTVVHKPQSCTAQVLGKLVDQVHTLESRLENLEIGNTLTDTSFGTPKRRNCDSSSFDSRSFDRKAFTFPRRRRRKVFKKEKLDHSVTSLDSVTSRGVPRLKLNFEPCSDNRRSNIVNDSPSMDGDLSSIVSTPSKNNDKLLLNEIDEFLTKVETYESPESKFKHKDTSLSPENVIKATGDYISQKFGTQNDEVRLQSGIASNNVLDKYIYLAKNSPVPQGEKQTDGGNPSSSTYKPIEDTSVRPVKIPVSEAPNKIAEEAKSPSIRRLNFTEKEIQPTSTPKKPSYLDTFRPSSNKIYDRASKVLEQYKTHNYSNNTHYNNSVSNSSYMLPKEEFKMPQMRPFVMENKDRIHSKLLSTIDTDLLSLSELWGEKGDKAERVDSIKLEEERLKREHCEAMIQQLQKKVLEQQEKLAVAIKVDRAKDSAIAKLREAWIRLTGSLDRAEERHQAALEKMVREVDNFKMVANEAQKKTNHFETELYKALDLAHDYQDKCKALTAETKRVQEETNKALEGKGDAIAAKEREIEVLKENYETVMQLNKQSTDCVRNLEDALEREKCEHEVTRSKNHELSRKLQSVAEQEGLVEQERNLLKEKINEERARNTILEKQLCDQQNQLSELLRKFDTQELETKTLRRQLEQQRVELRAHYQKQLEEAVRGKVREFQGQLEAAERALAGEVRERQASVADTYNKQIATIEDQHKLEINVLEEKQREEIKLYRLQLVQATEKIALLESKLDSFRRRRGQMAAQLHGVMEAQWRQALRILTAGPRAASPSEPAPTRATDAASETDLQRYVQLLLTKPPTLDGSGDSVDARPDVDEPTSDRPAKPRKSLGASKPPWKA